MGLYVRSEEFDLISYFVHFKNITSFLKMSTFLSFKFKNAENKYGFWFGLVWFGLICSGPELQFV